VSCAKTAETIEMRLGFGLIWKGVNYLV